MTDSDMYARVSWMVPADEAILKVLALREDLVLRTGAIADNTGYGRAHVKERLNVLVEKGLVEKITEEGRHDRFRVTDLGLDTRRERVTAEDLENL
jgi:DNA-binding transcriptional ArsR family regulator